MLESISWYDFLTTTVLLVGSYYIISALLLYSNDITAFFKKSNRSNSSTDNGSKTEFVDNLLGKPKYDAPGKSVPTTLAAEEMQFQPSQAVEEEIPHSSTQADTILIGTVADFLQEAKTLAEVVKGNDPVEITSLFKSLVERYANLSTSHYQSALSIHLYTSFKEQDIEISLDEINAWWLESKSNSHP